MIVTGHAKSRTKVAQLLRKNRNTISEWRSLYETGGLAKLLEIYHPAGVPSKITEAALTDISEVMHSDQKSRTYKELHQLIVTKHRIDIHYSNVHHFVRYKLGAKAKVSRPVSPKKKKLPSATSEVESGRDSESV